MGFHVGRIRGALLTVVLAAAVAVPGVTKPASAEVSTPSSVAQVVAAMGAGWNLGNALEANANGYPSETAWGNPVVTQGLIDDVKGAGSRRSVGDRRTTWNHS